MRYAARVASVTQFADMLVGALPAFAVNKQDTPLDADAKLRVQASVDAVMEAIMKNLGVAVPMWDEGTSWASHAAELGPLTAEAAARAASKGKSGDAGKRAAGSAASARITGPGKSSVSRAAPSRATAAGRTAGSTLAVPLRPERASPATSARLISPVSGALDTAASAAASIGGGAASATHKHCVSAVGGASRPSQALSLASSAGIVRALRDEYASMGPGARDGTPAGQAGPPPGNQARADCQCK